MKPRPGAYMAAKGLGAERTAADHELLSVAEVRVSLQAMVFLDPEVKSRLEAHVRSRTALHRWGLPKLVQDSLRAFLPPGLHPQMRLSQPQQQHKTDSDPKGKASPELLGVRHRTPEKQSKPVATTSPGQKATALISPELKPFFLPEEALDLLAFHIQHKKIQHAWGRPSIALRSLRAFSPLPPDSRVSMKPRPGAYLAAKGLGAERTAADHEPLSVAEVRVSLQAMVFLDPEVKSRLEAHVRSRTALHRWGLPKLVQDSLRAFLPPGLHPQTRLSQPHQQHETHSDPKGEASSELLGVRHRTPEKQKRKVQRKPVATTSPGQKAATLISPGLKPILPEEALDLLAFHIQHKKIQHAWGHPSVALRSLCAFAPFPFEAEKNTQHKGKSTTEGRPWAGQEVRVVTPSLSFLSPDTNLRLEAHLSSMLAKHRWGLPKLVQHSLNAFLPPAPSSASKVAQMQPLSALPRQSIQAAEAGRGPRDDSKQEAVPGRRETGYRENVHQKKRATAFSPPAGGLPFLPGEVQELLEFHMQRKKVQHMWGLPSTVLKSLRVFAPFPHEPAKHAQDATVTLSKRHPWDTEVHIPAQGLFFLDADTKERLEAHVRHRTAEHRWGLPKLVQQSVMALLPPASLSHSGDTKRQPRLHRQPASPQAPVIQIATERSVRKLPSGREMPEGPPAPALATKLPFLTDGNRDALEFHIQRKKMQHEWGLPLTVQKSVHAFAPIPPELPQGVPSPAGGTSIAVAGVKDAVGEIGIRRTKKPWATGTVKIAVPSLNFLGPDTKETLEAHLRNLTIEHRWGLPGLVQKSMRAFIPLPSHLDLSEIEDQELPSAYSRGKASDAPFPTEATQEASPENQHTYHPEPLHETDQDEETDSYPAAEELPFCPGTKPEHAMAMPRESGSWIPGRESLQRSMLLKRPHLKATQRQKPMVVDPRWDPRVSSLSSSSPGPKKHGGNPSSWSTNLPRTRYSSGRTPSGTALIRRSSKTMLRNRKGMSQEEGRGFQTAAESSHPRAGPKEPRAPQISYPGWEPGSSQKQRAYPCACYLRAHQDDSGSSLPSDAEQGWGKPKEMEPDMSGYPGLQDAGLSSEESPTAGTHSEQEFPSAGTTPQHSIPLVQSRALYTDTSAGPRRQAGRAYRENPSGTLPKRGSRLGGNWEKKKAQPYLPRRQSSVRALRRWSSKDLCEACRAQKTPLLPKGRENPTSEAALSPQDSREFNRHRLPAPQSPGSLERKGGFQGRPEHNLPATTGDDMVDQKAEGATISPSKEPRPLSTGGVSQFSTECEWEQVGDWETEEEDTGGRRSQLRKEEGGSPGSARERPRRQASQKAQGSPKCASSPAAVPPKTSPKSAVVREEPPALVKTEKRGVLGPDSEGKRAVVRMRTVRVKGPEGTQEEEEGMLHWRTVPSQKGPLPGKEAAVRRGSGHPSGTPRGSNHLEREALKMAQEISQGIWKEGQHIQFIQGASAKDMHGKLSLLGNIVEKKLFLQQGFRVWVQSQDRENGSRRRTRKSSRASQPPPTFRGTRAAQVRWVEVQCSDSQGTAGRALPARPPQRPVGKTGSPAVPGYSRRPSRREKKEVTRGSSRNTERRK